MTTFPALYREHVQPRLERECCVRGTFVALGMETFGVVVPQVVEVLGRAILAAENKP